MGAILNGLSLSKVRPYGSGFLIFSDYGRAPIRLAAIMEIPVIYIFTHDSIGVGEDGPTHQPIEQLASLRAIPGPDHAPARRRQRGRRGVEASSCSSRHEPVALILTRQALPTLDRTKYAPAAGLAKGAYVLADAPGGKPEVHAASAPAARSSLCVAAHEQLTKEGIKRRVVSMPSWELFERPAAGVPRHRAAAVGHRARRGRAGLDVRLGALRRADRRASSACRRSARRRRSRSCRRSSASSRSRGQSGARAAREGN